MGGTPWDAQSRIGHAHESLESSAQISVIYSWKTTLVAHTLPFFPLGIKPLDRDSPPFIPPGALGAAPRNAGSHPKDSRGRNETELWNPGAFFPGIILLETSPNSDQI